MRVKNQSTTVYYLAFLMFALGTLSGCKSSSKNKVPEAEKSRPNIVVFFVDDLGFFDLGFRNEKFYTPKIDQLARESMEFKYAYVPSPTCSPSRVGLYTGIHPAKQEFFRHTPDRYKDAYHYWDGDPVQLPSRNFLPLEAITYAEALKEHNYKTFFAGKWHIGNDEYIAENQGFDHYVAGNTGGGLTKKYRELTVDSVNSKVYVTDLLTDSVVNFIQTYDSEQPFLLQFSYWNVHTPTVGRDDLLEFYEAKGLKGKDAHYAAQVTSVDESVGKVLNVLEEKGFGGNTVVIFTSDQGSFFPNLPLRGTKAVGTALYEGSARIPFLVKWPNVTKPGEVINEHVSTLDVFPTLLDIAGDESFDRSKLDGLSLSKLIREGKALDRDYLYFYRAYDAQYASVLARDGWKLVAYRGKKYELFNIYDDIAEENNVAAEHPEKVDVLVKKLREWEQSADLLLEE